MSILAEEHFRAFAETNSDALAGIFSYMLLLYLGLFLGYFVVRVGDLEVHYRVCD